LASHFFHPSVTTRYPNIRNRLVSAKALKAGTTTGIGGIACRLKVDYNGTTCYPNTAFIANDYVWEYSSRNGETKKWLKAYLVSHELGHLFTPALEAFSHEFQKSNRTKTGNFGGCSFVTSGNLDEHEPKCCIMIAAEIPTKTEIYMYNRWDYYRDNHVFCPAHLKRMAGNLNQIFHKKTP